MKVKAFLRSNIAKLIIVQILLLAVAFFGVFCQDIFTNSNYPTMVLLGAALLISRLLCGPAKIRTRGLSHVIQTILIFLLAYFLLIYLSGLFIGFLKSPYPKTPVGILGVALPIAVISTLMELLRFYIVQKLGARRPPLIFTTILFALLDIFLSVCLYSFASNLMILKFIGVAVLGGFAKSALLTYLTYKSSFIPALMYQLVTLLYIYFVPLTPDLGDFVYSVLAVVLPAAILFSIYSQYRKRHEIPSTRQPKRFVKVLAGLPISALILAVVILVSGLFRYWALAVSSDSMSPTVSTGDIVIIDKDPRRLADIELGTIIAFRNDGKVVIHRLIELETAGEKTVATTKGDHNATADNWIVTDDELIGIVTARIPVIGWFTVWIDRTLSGGAG